MDNILVMGTGGYYKNKKSSVIGNIVAFVDNFKEGEFEGKPIIKPDKILGIEFDYIYVMSVQFCLLVSQLLEIGVDREKIKFGANLEPYNDIERGFINDKCDMLIDSNNNICYKTPSEELIIKTYDELVNIKEIYGDKSYEFYNSEHNCVVIDIGANIGGAAVWFANKPYVDRVYAYEPFHETYHICEKNVRKNKNAVSKVILKPAALGIENKQQKMKYNSRMSCGVSVIKEINDEYGNNLAALQKEINDKAFDMYEGWGLIDENDTIDDTIKILDISDEIKKIIAENQEKELVVKMDCEGSEYALFDKLNTESILAKIDVIMLEWHYNGPEQIEELLRKNGFSYFSFGKGDMLGTIYAVRRKGK